MASNVCGKLKVFHSPPPRGAGGGGVPPPGPPVGAAFVCLAFSFNREYPVAMFANKHKHQVETLEKSHQELEAHFKRLRDDFFTLQEQIKSWEIRMEEMADKTKYAIARHDKRMRDARGGNGVTVEGDSTDPITARIRARRKSKHGLFSQS